MNLRTLRYFFKSCGFLFLCLFFLFNKSILVADELIRNKSNKEDISGQININYLKNIPRSEYILGPGDYLTLIIAKDISELTVKKSISGLGTIDLPRLGTVYVQGLTKNELVDLLNKSYEKYINFPNVSISIENYRPMRIFIDGEVNSPGLYTISGVKKVKVDAFSKPNSFKVEKDRSDVDPELDESLRSK